MKTSLIFKAALLTAVATSASLMFSLQQAHSSAGAAALGDMGVKMIEYIAEHGKAWRLATETKPQWLADILAADAAVAGRVMDDLAVTMKAGRSKEELVKQLEGKEFKATAELFQTFRKNANDLEGFGSSNGEQASLVIRRVRNGADLGLGTFDSSDSKFVQLVKNYNEPAQWKTLAEGLAQGLTTDGNKVKAISNFLQDGKNREVLLALKLGNDSGNEAQLAFAQKLGKFFGNSNGKLSADNLFTFGENGVAELSEAGKMLYNIIDLDSSALQTYGRALDDISAHYPIDQRTVQLNDWWVKVSQSAANNSDPNLKAAAKKMKSFPCSNLSAI